MLRRVGQSDPHAGRSFQSFAADVAQVADKLDIKTFFVVGVRYERVGFAIAEMQGTAPASKLVA